VARIISIDYGTKRVGIAVSDPSQMIASGLATVSAGEIFDFLKEYFLKEKVECLVIGHPKKMNNQDSESFHYIKLFEKSFKEKFPLIPVVRIDERFTSSLALDTMIRGGMKKKHRQIKGNLDKISAAIILQSYLDSKEFKFNR
jgi:putative holliday junction resolvase